MNLGTVLPTARDMEINTDYAARDAANRERIASKELSGCERRIVGGEVRYYDTTDQYALVTSRGKVIWFRVCEDGDYRI
jgi:hypothetical protein